MIRSRLQQKRLPEGPWEEEDGGLKFRRRCRLSDLWPLSEKIQGLSALMGSEDEGYLQKEIIITVI